VHGRWGSQVGGFRAEGTVPEGQLSDLCQVAQEGRVGLEVSIFEWEYDSRCTLPPLFAHPDHLRALGQNRSPFFRQCLLALQSKIFLLHQNKYTYQSCKGICRCRFVSEPALNKLRNK
jgi:hypothetical protein